MIVLGLGDVTENVRKCVGQNTLCLRRIGASGHGVRFAGARLTVRENCAIVALQHFVDNRSGGVDVQVDLGEVQIGIFIVLIKYTRIF